MLSKKATIEFLSFFVIVAFLATTYTFGSLFTREDILQKDFKVGDVALKILEDQNEIQKNLFFIDLASENAANDALLDLGERGGIFGEGCKQGDFYVWSAECKPSAEESFFTLYEDTLLNYLGSYNEELAVDYDFSLDGDSIKINSVGRVVFGSSDEVPRSVGSDFFREGNYYNDLIFAASSLYGVDEALIKGVIKQESNFDPIAQSPKNAFGLMQITEGAYLDVKRKYNVDWSLEDAKFNPRYNILTGTAYLNLMLDRFGEVPLALAAYNAGPGNVERSGGIPAIKETRDYVRIVSANYDLFKGDELVLEEQEFEVTTSTTVFSEVRLNQNFDDYENAYLQVDSCADKENFAGCVFDSLGYKWDISGRSNFPLVEITTNNRVLVVEGGELVNKPIVLKTLVDLDSFKS